MFGFGGVFNRKPRQFDYRPRYYDPEVERREQRRKELLGADYQERYMTPEQRDANYVPGRYLRDNIKVRRGIGSSKEHKNSSTPLRLIIFLALLGLLIWWLMGTEAINTFFEKWLAK